ncbi:MAG: ATP-dependent RNA helicase RhlE [Verrucomicrobiales bacterium]|jgi:superfamily II DNA/RNA helicase
MEIEDGQTTFDELGLSEPVLKAVRDLGFEKPTPIQAQAIPLVLAGRDIIGASQTGTGKTAAFGLPVFSKLEKHGKFRCLVLEPTRELAAQVIEHFEIYAKHMDLSICLLHGGVGYQPQLDQLAAGVDVVIATPGRLLDHLSRKTLHFRDIDFLILDEVDRMLDMGFLPDVRKIVSQCKETRQTLFFSATMPAAIETFAKWALKDPAEISIGRRASVADTVTHGFYPVAYEQRDELLLALLEKTEFKCLMIFTRTKAEADKLTVLIKKVGKHNVTPMHSDIPQKDRTKALKGFRDGTFDVIVATDVAARGLDISNVTHVINYRVPENPEDYVHRIGRTGRAEQEGDAFTMLAGDELEHAEAVERYIDQKIDRRKLEGFNYTYTAMLDDDAPSGAELAQRLGRVKRKRAFRSTRRR